MADEQIQILITAIDEVSATVNKIEESVTGMATESKKQTESMSNAFKEQTGNILILGQAANTVNNIFDSYDNLQLRLENATDRVSNAEDRLARAKLNQIKVQKDETSTAEDLQLAQMEVDAATRGLSISQNNLAKANNKVLDTYLNMGMQVISLVASLPALITAIATLLTPATWAQVGAFIAMDVAGAPLLVWVVAIGLAIAAVIIIWKNWKEIVDALAASLEWVSNLLENVARKLQSMGGPIGAIGNFVASGINKPKQVGDAIIRPNGQIIETSPEDTIYATKGGIGNSISISINGPIYGVNPTDISRALAQELGKKLSL
jgi:hypothetical protein